MVTTIVMVIVIAVSCLLYSQCERVEVKGGSNDAVVVVAVSCPHVGAVVVDT